jgi:hypothetical protein
LVVAAVLAYSNSFASGFALDHKGLILDDARVHAVTTENLRRIFGHTYWWPVGESGLYRPFTTLTYLFNYAVLGNGEHPAGYHSINLLLHLGNVWLVWMLARRLGREAGPASWVAGLWALHPVLTESVTNIVGRADLLAGMAVLAGLWMHIGSREAAGRERLWWLAGLMAVTTAGVLSKEGAVAVAGVILLYDLCGFARTPASKIAVDGGGAAADRGHAVPAAGGCCRVRRRRRFRLRTIRLWGRDSGPGG